MKGIDVRGYSYAQTRDLCEQNAFGYPAFASHNSTDPTPKEARDRPHYGALNWGWIASGSSSASTYYGTVSANLKRWGVATTATLTPGDTFSFSFPRDRNHIATPAWFLPALQWLTQFAPQCIARIIDPLSEDISGALSGSNYIEAQIHSDVDKDDVAFVVSQVSNFGAYAGDQFRNATHEAMSVPLLWSTSLYYNTNNTMMVLDPMFLSYSSFAPPSSVIRNATQIFDALWTSGCTFEACFTQLVAQMPPDFILVPASFAPLPMLPRCKYINHLIGINLKGVCIYHR